MPFTEEMYRQWISEWNKYKAYLRVPLNQINASASQSTSIASKLQVSARKTSLPQMSAMGLAAPAASASAKAAPKKSGPKTHTLTAPTKMPGYKPPIPSDITHKLVAPSKGGGGDYKPPAKKAAAAKDEPKKEAKKEDKKEEKKDDKGPVHAISYAPSKRTHDLGKSPAIIKKEKEAKEKKKE